MASDSIHVLTEMSGVLTDGEASVVSNRMPFQGIYKDDFGVKWF